MAEEVLKVWNNWEDGMGFPIDDGQTNGYYGPMSLGTQPGLVGTRFGLRSPPQQNLVSSAFTTGYTCRHAFQASDGTNLHYYFLSTDGTDGIIHKYRAGTFSDESTATYTNVAIGHPVRYRGNWYFSGTNNNAAAQKTYKLTTVGSGNISGDTVTTGDASSGDGHLCLIGHQMAKSSRASGVSLLATDADPTVAANWGSYFPVGDSTDTTFGLGGVSGLAFVLKNRGLYTFNDRGRAGLVAEDFAQWQDAAQATYWGMAPWKGGLVFSHPTGLYFYQLGELPVPIFIRRGPTRGAEGLFDIDTVEPRGLCTIGEYIYVIGYSNYGADAYLFCGRAKNGSPTDIAWNAIDYIIGNGVTASPFVFSGASNGESYTTLVLQGGNTTLHWFPLRDDGDPIPAAGATAFTGVNTADAWMSELTFTGGVRLTRVRVSLVDMDADSSYDFSFLFNENIPTSSSDVQIGPRLSAGTVHEVALNYPNPVYRLRLGAQLHTSGATYSGGAIREIVLYGNRL